MADFSQALPQSSATCPPLSTSFPTTASPTMRCQDEEIQDSEPEQSMAELEASQKRTADSASEGARASKKMKNKDAASSTTKGGAARGSTSKALGGTNMGNRLSHAVDGAEVHGPTASKADIGNSTSKPSSDDDKEYPVRALLKWRFTPRTKASPTMPRPVEVLVAWKGYSDKDNTWEPEENLHATCRDMLMFFWHHKQKGRTQALSRRSKRAIKTFPVHKIVDHRLAENPENGPEYLVDWVGYPIKERSWEPGTNLPRLVIDEYMGL